jgi:hypothetical protein
MILYVILIVVTAVTISVSLAMVISGIMYHKKGVWRLALSILLLSAAVNIYAFYHYLSSSIEYIGQQAQVEAYTNTD